MALSKSRIALAAVGIGGLVVGGCPTDPYRACGKGAGVVLDEAKWVGRTAQSLPAADQDSGST